MQKIYIKTRTRKYAKIQSINYDDHFIASYLQNCRANYFINQLWQLFYRIEFSSLLCEFSFYSVYFTFPFVTFNRSRIFLPAIFVFAVSKAILFLRFECDTSHKLISCGSLAIDGIRLSHIASGIVRRVILDMCVRTSAMACVCDCMCASYVVEVYLTLVFWVQKKHSFLFSLIYYFLDSYFACCLPNQVCFLISEITHFGVFSVWKNHFQLNNIRRQVLSRLGVPLDTPWERKVSSARGLTSRHGSTTRYCTSIRLRVIKAFLVRKFNVECISFIFSIQLYLSPYVQ